MTPVLQPPRQTGGIQQQLNDIYRYLYELYKYLSKEEDHGKL